MKITRAQLRKIIKECGEMMTQEPMFPEAPCPIQTAANLNMANMQPDEVMGWISDLMGAYAGGAQEPAAELGIAAALQQPEIYMAETDKETLEEEG